MLILKELRPREPNCSRRERRRGGNRRPRTWTICPVCLTIFPMPNLRRRFCSYACKVKAQTTGRRTFRRTTAQARNAQSLVRYHVQAGNLVRPDAREECGATNRRIEAAHFNYDEPLRVRWLCRSCHVRWDKQHPKGGTVVVTRNSHTAETPPAVAEGGESA